MAEKDAETRHWFTKCRAAMLSEAPKVIQDTLADAEQLPDGGDSVQAERRQLEERLSTLVRKAVQEMRSLGRSKDFKAVELALMKYGDYPKESDNDPWDVLQAHREDLVRAAKKRLRDVALVSDPVLLGRELETYKAYDKAARYAWIVCLTALSRTTRSWICLEFWRTFFCSKGGRSSASKWMR